ncbi:MAG: aminotransferase class V-fold PLP-dependent enzyme [Planctomycetota bacterium]
MTRIYLDNAATSWPKPEAVYAVVDDWQRRVGASYARGTSSAADETRAIVDRARRGVAKLIGESDPRRVLFTGGGTDAINLAVLGMLRDGDHVVATVCDHNAVLRSLASLDGKEGSVRVDTTYVDCDSEGLVGAEAIADAIQPNTRMVAILHASNVTGTVQPIEEVARLTKPRGIRLLVDAAQTMGRWPLDVETLGADLVAAPGHKGLLGPLGVGVLWIGQGVEEELRPRRFGGAASGGELLAQPTTLPDKYEAGSLNVPAIAGLTAGVEHVESLGVNAIRKQVFEHRDRLARGLAAIDGVTVYGPAEADRQAGVVSFQATGYDSHELAMLLSQIAGVESRAGLHCAPRLHAALGTSEFGGLVRLSPGTMTTSAEIDATVEAVSQLAATPTV